MTNYGNGKIYKIIGNVDDSLIYVGSTTKKYLSQRMVAHKACYRLWKANKTKHKSTATILFEKYGLENCTIVLLENCKVTSKDELLAREQHYINSLNCVNRNNTFHDHKAYNVEYYQKNKNVFREYQLKHADKIKEYTEAYVQIRIDCEVCNRTIAKCKQARHNKTLMHVANLAKLEKE